MPPDTVFIGRSAAWLLGVRYATSDDPVEVVVRPLPCPRPGTAFKQVQLAKSDVILCRRTPLPLRATTAVRTAWDLATQPGLNQAALRDYAVKFNGAPNSRRAAAWPDLKLALTTTAKWHARPDQMERDARRRRDLIAAGWQVFQVTRSDLHNPDILLYQLAIAIDRRRTAS